MGRPTILSENLHVVYTLCAVTFCILYHILQPRWASIYNGCWRGVVDEVYSVDKNHNIRLAQGEGNDATGDHPWEAFRSAEKVGKIPGLCDILTQTFRAPVEEAYKKNPI